MSGIATARQRINDARRSTGIIGMHTALVTALASPFHPPTILRATVTEDSR
jgi:hypothetical protein